MTVADTDFHTDTGTHTHLQKNMFNIPVLQPWPYTLSSVSHMSRTNVEPITK